MLIAFAFIDRIVAFVLAPARRMLPPGSKPDLHRADRSLLALHRHRAAGRRRDRRAVRAVSVLAADRAGALRAPEEVRDPVRRAHDDRRGARRGLQPLHRLSVHDRVLRNLQLRGPGVPAARRGHVRSLREDAARDGRGVPDPDGGVLPREDGDGDGAVPVAQHQVRDPDHLHHRRRSSRRRAIRGTRRSSPRR